MPHTPMPHTPTDPIPLPETPWASPADAVVAALGSGPDGLTTSEAARRLSVHGPNRLRAISTRSLWSILVGQFRSLVTALLVSAAIAAFAFEEHVEGWAVVVVVLLNAAIGFVTERRAHRSMEALRELGVARTTVRRDGRVHAISADALVPGDIVVLEAGDILTADLRLVSASRLQADESALTGESLPVGKDADPIEAATPLPERTSMLHKGTALTRGTGEGVVVATGMGTALGVISDLVSRAEGEVTPLEERLAALARRLILFTVAIAVLVAIAAISSGRSIVLAVEMAIALAVAAIPEGLPIVATVALARGMVRMARRNALVERLAAVETLGSTTVILTDKTGTLTENRMTVVDLLLPRGVVRFAGTGLEPEGAITRDGKPLPPDDPELRTALEVAALCNNATLDPIRREATGDPTEVALLVAAAKAGIDRAALLATQPELREIAFDPDAKRMATIHGGTDRARAVVKGAAETLIPLCTHVRDATGDVPLDGAARDAWLTRIAALGETGERTLALAVADLDAPAAETWDFTDLRLVGAVGMVDPPRATVRPAIEACHRAGIELVMVTGDHGATGRAIAKAVGLVPRGGSGADAPFIDARDLPPAEELTDRQKQELRRARVIARATPRQKLDLIALHQAAGGVVAMTGDGVNDAPALKKADIGVAMGMRGTQVAREASDMVLRDDELGSIVAAIDEGRTIFSNIRKFVVYLMSCNVSEVVVVAASALMPGPLAILPLQILFLNLVTDVFPALALGVCKGSPGQMREPPRDPRTKILEPRHWRAIGATALLIAASVLGAFIVTARSVVDEPDSRLPTTVAFLTLALAQLGHVFAMRSPRARPFSDEVTRNGWVWGAVVLCIALLVAAVHLPFLAEVLEVESPGVRGWTIAVVASLVPVIGGQVALLVAGRRARRALTPEAA